MGEVVGVATVGSTSYSEIFNNTAPIEVISAMFAGGVALTLSKGRALKDSTTAGLKVAYTNGDASPTGLCILMEDIETTTTSGAVMANGLVMGTVNSSKILDAAGAAVDSTFKNALPNVRFA